MRQDHNNLLTVDLYDVENLKRKSSLRRTLVTDLPITAESSVHAVDSHIYVFDGFKEMTIMDLSRSDISGDLNHIF